MTAFIPYRISNGFLLVSKVWRVCIFLSLDQQLRSAARMTHFNIFFCQLIHWAYQMSSDAAVFQIQLIPIWLISPNRCLIAVCSHTVTDSVQKLTVGKLSIKRLPSDLKRRNMHSLITSRVLQPDSMPQIHFNPIFFLSNSTLELGWNMIMT